MGSALGRRGLAGRGSRRDRRRVDCARRIAGRLHAPDRRGRAIHRRVRGVRSCVREGRGPRSAAGEGRAQAGRRRRHAPDRVRRRRDDAGRRRQRRPEAHLEGRRLHPRRAHLGQLDRDRPGRHRARAGPADRAEQLVAGAHRPQGQRLLLPHDAVGHASGADPRAPDPRRARAGEDDLARGAQRRVRHGAPADPQALAREARHEDAGPAALRPDRSELQLRGRRHRQGQSRRLRHPRLPGELREDRLRAAPHREVQRPQAVRRRRLAFHDPRFIPRPRSRARAARSQGSTTGTKASDAFDKLFASKPGTSSARPSTRTTSTAR